MAQLSKQNYFKPGCIGLCFSVLVAAQCAVAQTPSSKQTSPSIVAPISTSTQSSSEENQQTSGNNTTVFEPAAPKHDAYSAVLKPYRAQYYILDGKDKIGTATRRLSKEKDQWLLQQFTSISKWFYTYSFEESSLFIVQNNQLFPLEYQSLTKRSFKDNRVIKSQFDWDKKLETGQQNKNRWTLELPNSVLDHLSYQIALRSKASLQQRKESFRISYKGQLESYQFNNEGRETLNTDFGELDTVLWAQEPNSKHDKFMHIWLAPSLNYLPVKITQFRSGDKEGTIQLVSVDWLTI